MRRTLAAAALAAFLLLGAGAHAAPFRVGTTVLRIVDRSRSIRLPDGRRTPRTLVTEVRYPALGAAGRGEVTGAAPAAGGPYPLIVFAHGFAVTPAAYARLLHTWAEYGYVVAAPTFPLSNAHAPGGPDERDIVNQPRDVSVAISRLLRAGGVLAGLADPARVAVAGHSDGAVTALAVAYDRRLRDPRVRAAVIMSGAAIRPFASFGGPPLPPLLATQGTADSTNAPANTYALFRAAPRPKYLLRLLGADHLPPYTYEQPQLGLVERVTLTFLDAYLEGRPAAVARLRRAGRRGVAALTARP